MNRRWLTGFILMIFLLVASSGEAISQAAAPKSATNGAKRVAQHTGTTPAPGKVTKASKVVDVWLEKKNDVTHFTIVGDGEFGKYETSKLGSPSRFVLDIKDVAIRFPRAVIKNENPFIKEVRIGKHPDKVRFVFYPQESQVPPFQIKRDKDRLVVSFGNSSKMSGAEVASMDKGAKGQGKSPSGTKKKTGNDPVSGVKTARTEGKAGTPVIAAQKGEVKKEPEPTTRGSKTPETPGAAAAEQASVQTQVPKGDAGSKQAPPDAMTLEESIKIALERNLRIHSAKEQVLASEFRTKAAFTDFLPKWTAQYNYTHYSKPTTIDTVLLSRRDPITGDLVSVPGTDRDVFNLGNVISQPIYSGGALTANYRLEKIGIDIAKGNVDIAKLDIVLQARVNYFNILTAEKAIDVARQAVKQFESQLEVSRAFFEVGIVAKNDVLQAEVRLANAVQALVTAESALALTKASFNTLLRRDINTPVKVVDILEYKPYPIRFEEGVEEALRQRPEIKTAQMTVEQAKEAVKIAKAGFYPTISLSGNYGASSEEPSLFGDLRGHNWTAQALASFTIFEWGKTAYRVGESKVKVTQAEDSKTQLVEGIVFEVKQDYLNMLNAEKNIGVAQKSLEQAEENLRLNEERYKYQVATQTEVLDAVALLAQARQNYYLALSSYNIAKAQLERSMGRIYP